MKQWIAVILISTLFSESLTAGVGGRSAVYVGGTMKVKANTEFKQVETEGEALQLVNKKERMEIPYKSVETLEYGQKVGRRIGSAIAVGVFTMGIGGLLALSKKRRHFLSITFKGEAGDTQAAVIELGKEITRPTLKILEVRTGKAIEYESEEARQNAR